MKAGLFLTYHIASDDPQEARTLYNRMLQLAVAADRSSFSHIWTPEHHLIRFLASPSALIPAVQISQHVSCRVGTAVVVLPYHEPIRFAGEIAAADNAMGGRLDLGVARGAYRYEFDTFGLDFGESRDQFIETLDSIHELLSDSESSTSYHGKFINFDGAYIWPRPLQATMPMWIGAQSPGAVEDAAWRGYNVAHSGFLWDNEHIRGIAEAFARGVARREPGLPRPQLMVSRYAAIAESESLIDLAVGQLLQHWRVHRQLHDYTQNADARGIIEPIVGTDEPTPEQIRANLLFGTPDEVAEKLAFYEEVGFDMVTINPTFGIGHRFALDTVETFGALMARDRAAIGVS
jgi:alkanesulfonate monooxygenase SsuD/methylene tetrahydromethanopterin reductase-like flavin-dependent oxidoreductase (luciferase family)